MTWNYRVKLEDDIFFIVEAYYNKDGKLTATTENSVNPIGDTLGGLKENLEKMLKAVDDVYNLKAEVLK